MVYFPDEVFRNIASYLIDPYKADREKHASVWQMIRVERSRFTKVTATVEEFDFEEEIESTEDEYFVYISTNDESLSSKGFIPTTFSEDDHLHEFDNLHENIQYEIDGGYYDEDDEYHNYAFEQYE